MTESLDRNRPEPLYEQLRRILVERIENGTYAVSHRFPSENELAQEFSVSRITVGRAVREMVDAGYLSRIQGLCTFVAERKSQSRVITLRNIADEIRERGHRHDMVVTVLEREEADPTIAHAMNLAPGSIVFHSIVVHLENRVPVQLEDRRVLPAVAPEYLDQDFSAMTTFAYLRRVATVTEAENRIEATQPTAREIDALALEEGDVCLKITRRTWWDKRVTTYAQLYHPASRFHVAERFKVKLAATGY